MFIEADKFSKDSRGNAASKLDKSGKTEEVRLFLDEDRRALFYFRPPCSPPGISRFVATTKTPWCTINRPWPSTRYVHNDVCSSSKDTD